MKRRAQKYIVGNWKMNQKLNDIRDFFVAFNQIKADLHGHAWIAPQFVHIPVLKDLAFTLGQIQVGAQNVCSEKSGAYTGEVSAEALADLGVSFVIVGHSERRQIFAENNHYLAKKISQCLSHNLQVIYCVGETLQENEQGRTREVITQQLTEGLAQLSQLDNILVAYEPVWAIGTGKTATPEWAEEIHAFIRTELSKKFKDAADLPILYGGSVNPANFEGLMRMENIDGGLIGGASLKAKDFVQMCRQSNFFARQQ